MAVTEAQKRAQAKWREKNKDKVNACVRRYREKEPEKNTESNRKSSLLYLAKKKGFDNIEDYQTFQKERKERRILSID